MREALNASPVSLIVRVRGALNASNFCYSTDAMIERLFAGMGNDSVLRRKPLCGGKLREWAWSSIGLGRGPFQRKREPYPGPIDSAQTYQATVESPNPLTDIS